MRNSRFVLVAVALVGCGGSNGGAAPTPDMAPATGSGGSGIVGQHGVVVDYFNLTPLAGFTVTDGDNTTTTGADGTFVLPAPMGATLAPTVTGPSYSMLQLATATAVGPDVDLGHIPIPSTQTFMLEQSITGADASKGVVQVVIIPTGACTSLAGGTLTATAPAGASVAYFSPAGLPTATMMYDVPEGRPVAVAYDVDPGATLAVTLHHPTCTLAPAGTTYNGATFDGSTKIAAAEPGDVNSVLFLIAQ
jgi:hypothetical protein